ncbi:hypothetical protein PsorP6_006674 [Peronosclerospora sorghi]|uniref:Uncharacterized protein n=1 Tax=Peronosclerospora sorghi TaxID=230839 RepID=A0ACC0W306_9STRA|nr:hypothetical protein PsorP6_006674 [Peronosclerospora sorghi]
MSYINQWLLEIYLTDRQPLPINYNPQIRLKREPVPEKNALNQRATSLIASTLRFYRTLRDKHLEPDLFHTKPMLSKTKAFHYFCNLLPERVSFYGAAAFGAYPLDMSQYRHFFASTRVPKRGQDELQVDTTPSRHILVQRGIQFYTFDV